jgi:hypothetical protein
VTRIVTAEFTGTLRRNTNGMKQSVNKISHQSDQNTWGDLTDLVPQPNAHSDSNGVKPYCTTQLTNFE